MSMAGLQTVVRETWHWMASGKPLQAVDHGDHNVVHSRFFRSLTHPQPELAPRVVDSTVPARRGCVAVLEAQSPEP